MSDECRELRIKIETARSQNLIKFGYVMAMENVISSFGTKLSKKLLAELEAETEKSREVLRKSDEELEAMQKKLTGVDV